MGLTTCSVPNCENRTTDKQFTFHRFPKDIKRRKKWYSSCIKCNVGWVPKLHNRICSAHFEEDQFEICKGDGSSKLKLDAIPTVFVLPSSKLLPVPKPTPKIDEIIFSANQETSSNIRSIADPSITESSLDSLNPDNCNELASKSDDCLPMDQTSDSACQENHLTSAKSKTSSMGRSTCSVPNCKNRTKDRAYTFHRFPTDVERRKKWYTSCRAVGWIPKKCSLICSDHFHENQFELHRADGLKKLKPNAVPTIFYLPVSKVLSKKVSSKLANKKVVKKAAPKLKLIDLNLITDFNKDNGQNNLPSSSNATSTTDQNLSKGNQMLSVRSGVSISPKKISQKDSSSSRVSITVNNTDEKLNKEIEDLRYKLYATCDKLNSSREEVNILKMRIKVINENLSKFLAEDQIQLLHRKQDSVFAYRNWSNETILKSLQLKLMLGERKYRYFQEAGYPWPSYSTLNRRLKRALGEQNKKTEEVVCESNEQEMLEPVQHYIVIHNEPLSQSDVLPTEILVNDSSEINITETIIEAINQDQFIIESTSENAIIADEVDTPAALINAASIGTSKSYSKVLVTDWENLFLTPTVATNNAETETSTIVEHLVHKSTFPNIARTLSNKTDASNNDMNDGRRTLSDIEVALFEI